MTEQATTVADEKPTDVDDPGKEVLEKPTEGKDAKPTSIADDDGGADNRETPSGFPENWREQLAGDDKKLLNRLSRMASPRAILDSYLEAEKKISSGKTALQKPGDDATDDEKKAYREALGIPEAPDKYELKLKDNRQLGDADRPVFESLAKAAHEAGVSNAGMSAIVDWYFNLTEQQENTLLDDDQAHYIKSVNELRDEFGPADYKRNIAAINHLFEGASEKLVIDPESGETMGMAEAILGARMPNGRKVGGDATALRFLTRLGLDLLPDDVRIPDGETSGTIDDRLAAIRKMRREEPDKYNADQKLQAEERDLIDAQLKRDRRDKAA